MNKVLKTSPEGRRCKFPNCDRVLSIYNHQPYCRVHCEIVSPKNKLKPYKHVG